MVWSTQWDGDGGSTTVTLEDGKLSWYAVMDDCGRELSNSYTQSLEQFLERGPAVDTFPFYASHVPANVLEQLFAAAGVPRPAWYRPLSPQQLELFELAHDVWNKTARFIEIVDRDKPNLEVSDGWGFNPLFYAVLWGHEENIRALLMAGSDPHRHWPHTDCENVLQGVIRRGFHGLVREVLGLGVSPNLTDSFGRTPLMCVEAEPYVGRRTGLQVARILLEAGADPNHASNSGETPLHRAVRLGMDDVAEELRKALARWKPGR